MGCMYWLGSPKARAMVRKEAEAADANEAFAEGALATVGDAK